MSRRAPLLSYREFCYDPRRAAVVAWRDGKAWRAQYRVEDGGENFSRGLYAVGRTRAEAVAACRRLVNTRPGLVVAARARRRLARWPWSAAAAWLSGVREGGAA